MAESASVSKLMTVREAAESAARNLVAVRHWGDASFINLPMLYPSGSFVTVKLARVKAGYRVSDNGFAFREIESFGAQRSFAKAARKIAEENGLETDRRSIYVDVTDVETEAAILAVSGASQRVAEQIVLRASDLHAEEISDALQQRLISIFGLDYVNWDDKVAGASSTTWRVSAVTRTPHGVAVFQAVTPGSMSVYRTSAAFHDLAALDTPPALVSVVDSKPQMGKNLSILAQAGRVIEVGEPPEVYLRAAA